MKNLAEKIYATAKMGSNGIHCLDYRNDDEDIEYIRADSAYTRLADVRAFLQKSKREHYCCDDSWYSCPMHPDGCSDDSKPKECNCGADKFNAELESIILKVDQLCEHFSKHNAS